MDLEARRRAWVGELREAGRAGLGDGTSARMGMYGKLEWEWRCLPPSGSRGLILGLIRGRRAGETRCAAPVLPLPRFLVLRATLLSAFLSRSRAPGVEAIMGDANIEGLAIAELGRADEGVLSGPSLGVFRAARRGVSSPETVVLSCGSSGRRAGSSVAAAAGSSKSSKACSAMLDSVSFARCCSDVTGATGRRESRDFGVAALPDELCC